MAYIPDAVAAGYLREPETELPLPGAGFAQCVKALITTAATRPEARATEIRSAARDAEEATHRTLGRIANR